MFESVEQLEKEVKDFQKNILASSELVKSIESLIAVTKAQKEDFADSSSKLVSKMDSHTDALRENYEEALEKLVKENSSLIKELITNGDELLKEMKVMCQGIKKSMDTKLLLLSVGVGASLILTIVSFLLR